MKYSAWLQNNTASLAGKTVAVTGSTGGLGQELCRFLAMLGARLILVDRNRARSEALRETLLHAFPQCTVRCVTADLEDMRSVRAATAALTEEPLDVFIHNAGAYSIPRRTVDTGYDNVFQINFVSPYYMIRTLLPHLAKRRGRVVAVGSIAHTYSRIDPTDIDFADRRAASKVYGNAKRFLMYSLYELFKTEREVTLAVTHPGISLTGITNHYPKVIFALIKHPMKWLFMKPKKACLSILNGVFESCEDEEWIGPRWFDVWGLPKKTRVRTARAEERRRIGEIVQTIYSDLSADERSHFRA